MTTTFSSRASMFGDSANPGDNTITGDTPAPDATSSQPSSRQATSLTSIKDVSDVPMDMDDSSTSIPTNLPKSPEPEPDSIIIHALKSRFDRDFVLNLAESMESLIAERSPTNQHPQRSFLASTTLRRLLIHKCSAYYRLDLKADHVSHNINLTATSISRIPSRRISELVPHIPRPFPSHKIMQRAKMTTPSGNSGSSTLQIRSTLAEREAAYAAARARIFQKIEDMASAAVVDEVANTSAGDSGKLQALTSLPSSYPPSHHVEPLYGPMPHGSKEGVLSLRIQEPDEEMQSKPWISWHPPEHPQLNPVHPSVAPIPLPPFSQSTLNPHMPDHPPLDTIPESPSHGIPPSFPQPTGLGLTPHWWSTPSARGGWDSGTRTFADDTASIASSESSVYSSQTMSSTSSRATSATLWSASSSSRASSTSSRSRSTSSKHPVLPARPDWAIGLSNSTGRFKPKSKTPFLRDPRNDSIPMMDKMTVEKALDFPMRLSSGNCQILTLDDLQPLADKVKYNSASQPSSSLDLPYYHDAFEEIIRWVNDSNSRPMFWLLGMEGTGKSTIARTVARILDEQCKLGASFFFSGVETDRCSPSDIIPCLAYQLSCSIPTFEHHIAAALSFSSDARNRTMEIQQHLLIAEPLKIAAKHAPFDVVVFVLDALNEGLNERQVKEMITHLAFISDKLRPQVNLKVMITCRPTDHIIGLIGEPNVECVSVVSDLDSSAGSSIPFASPEEIATSIDELASSLPIFQQSAIDIAEQASLRVCAFNTWAENSRQHREHISNDVFDSLEARYEAHQQLLALRLRQTSMLEMLSSHLDIVKRLFLLVSNIGSASNATVENLLTDFIIAWIIITDADELKAALNIDERSKANSAFVKAFALDMRKLRKKQSMKQATMSISKSILDEIFRGLWDQLSERFGTSGTEIESQLEEHQLPLPKLVEVAGERFPVLHEIQQALSLLPSNSNPHATLGSNPPA